MIVDAIRQLYEADAAKRVSSGNPTGSRFGTCCAQSQMLRYRKTFPPAPPRARNIITWEEGDRVEAWFSEVIEQAFPNRSGLAQEPFYFPIPVTAEQIAVLMPRIRAGRDEPHRIWGTVEPGFVRPTITPTAEGRAKLSLLRRDQRKANPAFFMGYEPLPMGFILDPEAKILYAPTFIDRVINHPDIGLCVLEKKSMSNATFRRALVGNIGYGMRCQLAGMVAATGLPAAWLCYRKETGHLCEILYTPKAEQVRVQITKLNGSTEVFFVDSRPGDWQPGDQGTIEVPDDDAETGWKPYADVVVHREGSPEPTTLPGDAEWDEAQTWTPYDPHLLDQIRARVLRVLLFSGEPDQVYREYGPSFTCPVCDGTTIQRRAKNGKRQLKEPKPCIYCHDGIVDEVELPMFPCGYCGVVRECWKAANLRIELDTKPHYYVTRAGFEASGIRFYSPDERPAPSATLPAREPSADEPCPGCGGTGRVDDVECVICEGTGRDTQRRVAPDATPHEPPEVPGPERTSLTEASLTEAGPATTLHEELTGEHRPVQQKLLEGW